MVVPVSVVIPCFRCSATVERAVESVLSQTLRPGEIVLVDDASDDNTVHVLERLVTRLKGDMHVTLVSLPTNLGAASARNAGWQAAHEKYVAFLDADATWFPKKLEIQYPFMEGHPEVALSGHLHVIGDHGRDALDDDKPGVVTLTFMDLLWRNRFITSSAMIRRSAPLRFKDGQRHMEDHRLWLDVAHANLGIARIELPLAVHYKLDFGAGGLSADLLEMEKAELDNYWSLFRRGAINFGMLAVVLPWSLLKFIRRLVIVVLRRLFARDQPSPR